ncbi:hypothetical protein [Mesorhizobium shangrilense]|uniref:Uncharacterized protein n=1 Tax=Mesorhizobium shangrilense TaxID=460060 RepID=A0ABV2DAY1_9HYPH
MKADMFSFPKAPADAVDRGVLERARLASKRDQQKWNPVLRPIALGGGIGDQQKRNPVLQKIVLQGMHS